MSTHDLFLRFHSLFGDMHILEIQSFFFTHLSNFACTFYKMVQHIRGNTYHISDTGNVNNITVTYLEKQKHAEYFPVCYPAAFSYI